MPTGKCVRDFHILPLGGENFWSSERGLWDRGAARWRNCLKQISVETAARKIELPPAFVRKRSTNQTLF